MSESRNFINKWGITLVVAIVFAAGGFFGGIKYQQTKVPSFVSRFGNGQTANGQFQRGNGNTNLNRNGFRPVSGEIVSADDKSITVKMQDGSTKIVLLSDATTYSKSSDGQKSDLTVGTQVAVFGSDNSDGSVTAQNVQIDPLFKLNTTR